MWGMFVFKETKTKLIFVMLFEDPQNLVAFLLLKFKQKKCMKNLTFNAVAIQSIPHFF